MIAIIQIVIFTIYLLYVWCKIGIQKSISESYYSLKQYNMQYAFTAFCMTVGILQLLHSTNHSWYFLSGAGLVFAGVAAEFKEWKTTNIIHYTGAVMAIIFSIVGLCIDGYYYAIIPILIILIFCTVRNFNNKLWWLEIVSFYAIMITILINKI